jgi:hypothetical protein
MPEKPSQSNSITRQQQQPISLVTEDLQRKQLISDYLKKYAVVANRNTTPTLFKVYEEALRDIPISRLRAALVEWLETGDRFPWPGDLRQASEL